ncbi:hypothetical protein MPER_03805 [Moniliophthora perniciosa FA553]|nr:hypothetical protein MPER_03805 [Moniliophthora perniciosa FA553]
MPHIMIALSMAGQHTSSATDPGLCFTWPTILTLRMSRVPIMGAFTNSFLQRGLYQEQVKHFSNPDGSFRSMSYEELRELPVLDSVIRETLRVHPPIHSIMRYVRDDVPVPPTLSAPSEDRTYIVPKGHYVLASPAVSQMDPLIWRNPEKWDPARWSDPEGIAAQALKTYVDENGEKIDYGFGAVSKGTESPYQPFGAGKHRCIGEQFAYLQLGTLLSTFVRRMELRIPTGVPAQNYHTMITMPQTPRRIHYRRRKAN